MIFIILCFYGRVEFNVWIGVFFMGLWIFNWILVGEFHQVIFFVLDIVFRGDISFFGVFLQMGLDG